MASATFKRFDVKHGITVNGLPFVDEKRNITVNDLTVQGVSTIIDTRTITSVDPIISLGASGKTYTSEQIITGSPGRIKFAKADFADIAVGDAIKYEVGSGGTQATGLVDGTVYYVASRDSDVTSSDYRTITLSATQGGAELDITDSGSGDQEFTLNPLRDLDQDLGIEFNYVDSVPKKGFFGYQDTTGHFTFLLDAVYSGSDTESDDSSPIFTGTKGGVEAKYVKLQPTAALTSSFPAVDIDQVWNNAGVEFKALELSITDTASQAGSSLLDFTVGGNQKLLLRKDGALAVNTPTISGALTVSQGSIVEDNLLHALATWNDAGTDFVGINLEITETAFGSGSKLVNFYASGSRNFSIDGYGVIDSNVEFVGGGEQTAITLDVTDTSSTADSLLLDLQVGSVSKFNVDKNGNILTTGELEVEGPGSFRDIVDVRTQKDGVGAYQDTNQLQTSFVGVAAGIATPVVINTFDKTKFTTGKYLVQMKQSNNLHSVEVLLIHDGSGVFMTEYAGVWNSSTIGLLDASVSGDDVNLTFTATAATVAANAEVEVKIFRTSLS